MPEARTTERLIKMAIAAAQASGLNVRGFELEKGGVVRVLTGDAIVPDVKQTQGTSCDEVFGSNT